MQIECAIIFLDIGPVEWISVLDVIYEASEEPRGLLERVPDGLLLLLLIVLLLPLLNLRLIERYEQNTDNVLRNLFHRINKIC